uniref:Uncharacterized protein n=1 Tax=Triticum urartu TaxID=4572 RepID=A0A8R7TL40_TRIUA
MYTAGARQLAGVRTRRPIQSCKIAHSGRRRPIAWTESGAGSLVAAEAGEQQLVRPQQRRGGRRRGGAQVEEVEVGGVGHAGGGGPERAGHLVGDERRAAERAGALVVLHPAVQAAPVEGVAAVAEPPHLVAAADAAEAHGAVPVDARRGLQLVEPHHGEHLLDDHGRDGPELGPPVLQQLRRRGGVVGARVVLRQVLVPEIQQVAEADGVEGPEEEAAEVAEQEEEVEQLLGEQQLGVADREAHACRLPGLAKEKRPRRLLTAAASAGRMRGKCEDDGVLVVVAGV